MQMKLPRQYVRLENKKDDLPGSSVYGYENNEYSAFIKIEPIDENICMPLDENILIDDIHRALDENTGLIKVGVGKTKDNIDSAYFILKSKLKDFPNSVQYYSTFDFINGKDSYELHLYFEERGMTGARDSIVYTQSRFKGFDGWAHDPYDSSIKEGFQMNLSEIEHYDQYFPNHPLTKLREIIKFIIENN